MRLFLLLFGLSGCLGTLPTPTPMTSLRDELPGAKCLVVFLPGAGDSARDFERHGFVEALRSRGLSVDVVSANATLGYYVKGLVLERLEADVIGPVKKHEKTWLMGVSMGGMGTLAYSRAHPEAVDGVLALAPYLGQRELIEEIKAAGGLAAWNGEGAGEERELWRWLKAVTSEQVRGPAIYVGWGTEDRLREGDALLGAALPKERVFNVNGGHKWTTWKVLFERFLAESDFVRECAK